MQPAANSTETDIAAVTDGKANPAIGRSSGAVVADDGLGPNYDEQAAGPRQFRSWI